MAAFDTKRQPAPLLSGTVCTVWAASTILVQSSKCGHFICVPYPVFASLTKLVLNRLLMSKLWTAPFWSIKLQFSTKYCTVDIQNCSSSWKSQMGAKYWVVACRSKLVGAGESRKRCYKGTILRELRRCRYSRCTICLTVLRYVW